MIGHTRSAKITNVGDIREGLGVVFDAAPKPLEPALNGTGNNNYVKKWSSYVDSVYRSHAETEMKLGSPYPK